MNKIEKAIAVQFKNDGSLAAIEFIRAAVKWFDYRNESLNDGKTVNELLTEYAQSILDYHRS